MTSGGYDDLEDFFGRARSSGPITLVREPAPAPARAPAPRARSRRAPSPRPPRPAARPAARPAGGARQARPVAEAGPARPARPVRPAPAPKRRPAPIDGNGFEARRRTQYRLALGVFAVVLVVAAIGAKLVDLQITGRSRWTTYGAMQRDGYRVLPAGRGGIYDRDGRALAVSAAQPDVVADPQVIRGPVRTARQLAPLLDVDEATLVEQLSGDTRYARLATTVSPTVAAKIRKLELPGIAFEDHYVRQHPSGDLAAAVIGRTVANGGVDQRNRQGLSGIESSHDRALDGEPGKVYFERDPNGRTIAQGEVRTDPAKPGTNLYLTLDQSLQYETERALRDQVAATGASSAMAVITRPSTGEVLSMASVAADDDGTVTNTSDNRPVTAVFEPGSVNKMITVAGALEEGLVEPDTVLDVPDHLTLYDKDFTDHDPHPTAAWSVTDILVTSSNIGTIKIARQLGSERVDGYLRKFGFGETTGLGFPSEENGIMLPLDQWSGTSIGAIPIGQGISVTALQMLAAYNVIANDGVYVTPKLVTATDAGSGRVPTTPSPQRRVVSVETARAMQDMLVKVVSDGTGTKAQVPGYLPGGKTGTARIPQGVDPADGYRGADGNYHYASTFVGFVDDADLSIIVTVQDAKTSIYGGTVAAPVFSHLASLALRRYQIPPPALVRGRSSAVPELSASARQVDGEDAVGVRPRAAG